MATGDIGNCKPEAEQGPYLTADLLALRLGTILAVGDLAYESGTAAEFGSCYDPTWGRFKDRTLPVPGNHEHKTSGASGYYAYWGSRAGPSGKGYYSRMVGDWQVIAINSSINVAADSTQARWLKSTLSRSTARCKLAFFHHPRFSSGYHGNSTRMAAVFKILYDARVSVVLAAHEHSYERFALMRPSGVVDSTRGVRAFVVGTGGAPLRPFRADLVQGSEARNATAKGVLRLTLRADGYDWQFLPVAGASYTDEGSGTCVPAP